jgi:hypothetical protein
MIDSKKPVTNMESDETIERRQAEWEVLNSVIKAFVADYEWDAGEDGYHVPTDKDRILIEDCINGLIADDKFMAAIAKVYPVRTQFPKPALVATMPEEPWRLEPCIYEGKAFMARAPAYNGNWVHFSDWKKLHAFAQSQVERAERAEGELATTKKMFALVVLAAGGSVYISKRFAARWSPALRCEDVDGNTHYTTDDATALKL